MLRIEDALARMLARTPLLPVENAPLAAAAGRVLRADACADMDLPPFDRARMDGYAVRSADTASASSDSPARLRAIGETAAGSVFGGAVAPGQAVRIMTGAPLPEGADAVEKIEVIEVLEDGFIELRAPVKSGQFITPRGIEARTGDAILKAGAGITPAASAVLASFGYANVAVSRRPRAAMLSTGSELVDVSERPGPAQIRNSNTYALAGYAGSAGAEIISTGIIRDDMAETRASIAQAAETADVILLSGGVSMGDYDLVKPALAALGADIIVERVAMHPGKPTVFARLGECVVFGLPGNPVSVAVSFHLFARPVLMAMQGAEMIHLPRVRAYLSRRVKGAPPRRSHQPARLRIDDGRAVADPLKWSGSSDLVAFVRAEALVVVPEDRERLEEGELAEIVLLGSAE
ncbi:MAG: molybdopterin molybdotransferase MoeA [Acidobacteria bacterium]|nr:molybdopterin molybdotransferase MoeA [Acidobacteriota bacterium]MCW5968775.1 molybdopterin molybdotransferase MoeA [Blastocatellales bacterium]